MVHSRGRYHALPLIASPLEGDGDHSHHGGHSSQPESQGYELKGGGYEGVVAVPDDQPMFREKEEASTMELFYDLFFVANLTSFTNVHAIDSSKSEYSTNHCRSCSPLVLVDLSVHSHVFIRRLLRHSLVHLASSRPLRCPLWRRLPL